MALPKSLSFLRLGTGSQVLEVYLDLICPFSAKQAKSLTANVIPLIQKGGKYEKELSVIIRPYAQPFHYLAAHHTEAVIVFGQQYPDLFWAYFNAVFDEIDTFKNGPGGELTGNQVRDKLTDIALKVLEDNKRLGSGPKSQAFGEFRSRLSPDPKGNGGNEGTEGFKHNIKIGRQNGIHVTPTVLFDGLKEDSVSSSWGKDEWEKFLAEKFKA